VLAGMLISLLGLLLSFGAGCGLHRYKIAAAAGSACCGVDCGRGALAWVLHYGGLTLLYFGNCDLFVDGID
jgi:hypothetical protein